MPSDAHDLAARLRGDPNGDEIDAAAAELERLAGELAEASLILRRAWTDGTSDIWWEELEAWIVARDSSAGPPQEAAATRLAAELAPFFTDVPPPERRCTCYRDAWDRRAGTDPACPEHGQ